MPKDERNKAYYEANKDKMIEKAKERNKERRIQQAEQAHHYEYTKRKANKAKKHLYEAMKTGDPFFKPFLERIVESDALSDITPKHLQWLTKITAVKEQPKNIIVLLEDDANSSHCDSYASDDSE
jgi:hypothetical protein